MPHVSRRHRKIGWPEFWLVFFVALAIAPATVWWRQQFQPEWSKTGGRITACEATRIHYNAQDYRVKATVSYEYTVGLEKYSGKFDGIWPEVGSPNALTPSEIDELKKPDKEIVVFYDPDDPSRSELHPDREGASPFWIVLTVAGLCVAGAYTIIIYPVWRA